MEINLTYMILIKHLNNSKVKWIIDSGNRRENIFDNIQAIKHFFYSKNKFFLD